MHRLARVVRRLPMAVVMAVVVAVNVEESLYVPGIQVAFKLDQVAEFRAVPRRVVEHVVVFGPPPQQVVRLVIENVGNELHRDVDVAAVHAGVG